MDSTGKMTRDEAQKATIMFISDKLLHDEKTKKHRPDILVARSTGWRGEPLDGWEIKYGIYSW